MMREMNREWLGVVEGVVEIIEGIGGMALPKDRPADDGREGVGVAWAEVDPCREDLERTSVLRLRALVGKLGVGGAVVERSVA